MLASTFSQVPRVTQSLAGMSVWAPAKEAVVPSYRLTCHLTDLTVISTVEHVSCFLQVSSWNHTLKVLWFVVRAPENGRRAHWMSRPTLESTQVQPKRVVLCLEAGRLPCVRLVTSTLPTPAYVTAATPRETSIGWGHCLGAAVLLVVLKKYARDELEVAISQSVRPIVAVSPTNKLLLLKV